MIKALTKHCHTEYDEMMGALIPIGNNEMRDIFKWHGFKHSRITNLEKTFDRLVKSLRN